MLKTAKEILNYVEGNSIWGDFDRGRGDVYYQDDVIKLINKTRIELLQYLANATYIADNNFHPVITKEEILKMIDQIK